MFLLEYEMANVELDHVHPSRSLSYAYPLPISNSKLVFFSAHIILRTPPNTTLEDDTAPLIDATGLQGDGVAGKEVDISQGN